MRLQVAHMCIYHHIFSPLTSLVPRPRPREEKGRVSFERFLGCAESLCTSLMQSLRKRLGFGNVYAAYMELTRMIALSHPTYHKYSNLIGLPEIKTAHSAQPRNRSNVTRPFPILWVGSGYETSLLLASTAGL